MQKTNAHLGMLVGIRALFSLLICLLQSDVFGQVLSISDFSIGGDGKLHISHTSDTSQYYILFRGDSVAAITTPRGLHLGAVGDQLFLDTLPSSQTSFYRILSVPMTQPRDMDGDGINDVYELTHAGILNPLNPADASQDADGDGISNLQEYLAGTDPGSGAPPFQLIAPAARSTFVAPADITIQIQITDVQTTRVEFFAGANLVGQSTTSPFTFVWKNVAPGDYSLRAEAVTPSKRLVSETVPIIVNIPSPSLEVLPASTKETLITVRGRATPGSTLTVDGGRELQTVIVPANGNFEIPVPLSPNKLNRLYATAVSQSGRISPSTGTDILQDSQLPNLFIDFPPNNADLISDSVVVAGRVGDLLSGFLGLAVKVNGVSANVAVGIGNNGTFERGDIPLQLGRNVITVSATDAVGNTLSKELILNRAEPGGAILESISGDRQKARIHAALGAPVVVKVTSAAGQPLANKTVSFDVVRSDGRLKTDAEDLTEGKASIQLTTDSAGQASVYWFMGSDSGCGNNRLAVTSKDITGSAFFCASADPALPSQINVGLGNNQSGEAGAFAPQPLIAWVNDSCNGIGDVPVTFTVTAGGARLFTKIPSPGDTAAGSSAITVNSIVTGHAKVFIALGAGPGNNIVEANFSGNKGAPAVFVLKGLGRGIGETSFAGVVLDNGNLPVGGAQCFLNIGNEFFQTISDETGRFSYSGIPSGPAKLLVNALTANLLGGDPIPLGSFPSLKTTTVLIPNADNTLPKPVLLPRLNPSNARIYDGTSDIVLTCEGIAGLRMTVKAGSMRLPDGTSPTPDKPTVISLNQVRHSELPMPMTDGASPAFTWTFQPAGATYNPPVKIEYPNMTGLPAGSIAYFLTYNHDTEKFEILGTGHVLADGSRIVTDPGSGLVLGGWGCNCPPYSVTGSCGGCN